VFIISVFRRFVLIAKENTLICPDCKKGVKKEGKLLYGKLYHGECADRVLLKMACRDGEIPKRIFIA
jgi:hypothetical protein